jgi:hypothetical protein
MDINVGCAARREAEIIRWKYIIVIMNTMHWHGNTMIQHLSLYAMIVMTWFTKPFLPYVIVAMVSN